MVMCERSLNVAESFQAMEHIRNNMAARASDLRLYLDLNTDHAKFNSVSPSSHAKFPREGGRPSTGRNPSFVRSADPRSSIVASRRREQPPDHDLP